MGRSLIDHVKMTKTRRTKDGGHEHYLFNIGAVLHKNLFKLSRRQVLFVNGSQGDNLEWFHMIKHILHFLGFTIKKLTKRMQVWGTMPISLTFCITLGHGVNRTHVPVFWSQRA